MTGATSPAKPKVPTAAQANRGIPAEEASGKDLDDPVERDAVFEVIHAHSRAQWGPALWELFHSLVLYVLVYSMWEYKISYVLMALLRTRLFIIFHDCAHGAYFPSAKANWLVGNLLGPLNHASFSFWARAHNHHHRHSNNTLYDQYSQSNPWTLEKYNKEGSFQKFMYRCAYTPLAFLVVLPPMLFWIFFTMMSKWYEHILSAAFVVFVWQRGMFAHMIITDLLAGCVGFYLFHMQHSFEAGQRWGPTKWSFFENGMSASSFLQVPWYLKYFTANIEYHHIHHLSPLVPLYRLPACHKAAGKLFNRVPRPGFWEGFRTLKPTVWDEANSKWVAV